MPAQPPAQAGDFVATGELLYAGPGGGRSAAYNQWRIVGRTVNMSYTGNNVWTGELNGQNMMLTASPGKLVGAGVNLHLFAEGDGFTMRGQWFQRTIDITITPKQLSGRTAQMAPGFELNRAGPNVYSGLRGPGGSAYVELKGEAANFPNVSVPQFYLALLAALG
ncbi:MAG TPA: hypothetical protein VFR85_00800 [Anaeromyxobacteraceae bacterium]|nr:hypothetical protein [Anaeromyxobacteraceae bacterium]